VREAAAILEPRAPQADGRGEGVQLVEIAAEQVGPQAPAPGDHRVVDVDGHRATYIRAS